MSILNEITTTAVDAVGTLRTKAAGVVVDVRKQLPAVEPKKVQSVVVEGAISARKQFIDLTARGEKIVRDLTGRTAPEVRKAATSRKPATAATAAKRTAARKTTAVKRTVKKAAPAPKK